MKTGHFRYMLIGVKYVYFISFGVFCFKYFIPKSTKKISHSSILRNGMGQLAGDIRKSFKITCLKKFELKEDAIYRRQVFIANYRPIGNSVGINCKQIINNDQTEISMSRQIVRESSYFTSKFYLNITRNCDLFRESRGYIEHPLSKTEFEFPIAFSILVYKDIGQVERLIRAIYRPHNYYCIHIDSKMDREEKNAVTKIANCLNNVFISKESIDVIWGNISLLEAELSCMKTLWPYKKWKYYINLAGQEFPLKTNREIIAILKDLEGANIVAGSLKRSKITLDRVAMKKTPPPHNISLTKGPMHIAATRYFVDFCIHDQRSLEFLEWLRETQVPDEFYFASLHYNKHLGIIGSYLGETKRSHLKPYFLRYVIWNSKNSRANCSGDFIRSVCILGVSELSGAYNSFALYANKFHLDFEHIALDCLEELLYERTWQEYIEDIPVNTSYYRNLQYAKTNS